MTLFRVVHVRVWTFCGALELHLNYLTRIHGSLKESWRDRPSETNYYTIALRALRRYDGVLLFTVSRTYEPDVTVIAQVIPYRRRDWKTTTPLDRVQYSNSDKN